MHRYINISLYSYDEVGGKMNERKLRRVIHLGSSVAVTLPHDWVFEYYVWIERRDSEIIIRPAEVQ